MFLNDWLPCSVVILMSCMAIFVVKSYHCLCLQAEQLQREIEQRRKDMEYRFTAFVSEQVNAPYKSGAPPNHNYH